MAEYRLTYLLLRLNSLFMQMPRVFASQMCGLLDKCVRKRLAVKACLQFTQWRHPQLSDVISNSDVVPCRSAKNAHEQLTGCLSQLMPIVYVVFFGLAGASLKLVSTHLVFVCAADIRVAVLGKIVGLTSVSLCLVVCYCMSL